MIFVKKESGLWPVCHWEWQGLSYVS